MRSRLKDAIGWARTAAVYLPVQRQNMHGGQMAPDTMIAVPVNVWEELLTAYDEEIQEDYNDMVEHRLHD